MKFLFTLLICSIIAIPSLGQLSGKVLKLEGKWQYKEGSGFEIWNLHDGALHGKTYRVTRAGDTISVEEMSIKKVNKTLVHQLATFNFTGDTTFVSNYHFIGERKKLRFVNIESNTPYLIEYKFGFLNRNKLYIRLQFGINDKQTELVLNRIKD